MKMSKNLKFFTFITLLLSIKSTAGIELNCTFQDAALPFIGTSTNPIPTDLTYTCILNTEITSDVEVSGILDTHSSGKSNSNVKVFKVNEINFVIMPQKLIDFFPNLEGIYINSAEFELLRNSDLTPFKGFLKYLKIKSTKMLFLEKDLLKDLTLLEFVDFSQNFINYIDPTAFNGPSLKVLNLNGVSCLNDGNEYEGNELTDFLTGLENSALECSQPSALQSVLKTLVTFYICDKSRAEKAEKNLEKCQNELENCNTTPEPDTTIEPATDDPTTKIFEDCDVKLQLQIIETNLYRNYTDFCLAEKEELNKEIEDLNEQLDKYLPNNLTCRFKSVDGIYTCIAVHLEIKSTKDQKVSWIGEHFEDNKNSDVKSLTIKSQNVQFLPLEVGKTFENLENFSIESSRLQKLRKNDFKTLEKLKKLILTGNEISNIESGTFDILTKLNFINLRNNKIANLPSKAFEKLKFLTHLDLGENKITQLRYDLIPADNKIEEFYGDKNQINKPDVLFIWRLLNADFISLLDTKCNKIFNRTIQASFKTFFSEIIDEC